jgi:hypothetical protein
MKKLLALILCSLSFSIFASDIEAEYRRVGAVMVAKPFDLKKFEAAIKATTHLKDDIDYTPAKNYKTLMVVAVLKDYVDVVKILAEKYDSDIRQRVGGPASSPITSTCLFHGSTDTYKYLYSLFTKEENEERKEADERSYIAGIKDAAAHAEYMRHLTALTADHDKIMKDVHSLSFKDFLKLLKPLAGFM